MSTPFRKLITANLNKVKSELNSDSSEYLSFLQKDPMTTNFKKSSEQQSPCFNFQRELLGQDNKS